MSLAYMSDCYLAAVRSLATSEASLSERLQAAWDDHVQLVWMKPCLTVELLRRHKALWERYTAPSDDEHSTVLRPLSATELAEAIGEIVALSTAVSVAAAQASDDVCLATNADLG